MDKDKDKLYKLTIYHNNGNTSYIKMTMQHVDEFMCLLCDSQYDFTYAIGYTKKDILSFPSSISCTNFSCLLVNFTSRSTLLPKKVCRK